MAVVEIERASHSQMSRNLSSTPRLILGSGRSGTTWVLDCLAEANGLRPIFEPLHPAESDIAASFAYDILTEEDAASELEEYFNQIAAGHVHSRWIDYRAPKGLVIPGPRQFASVKSAQRWFSGWRKYWKRRKKYAESTRRTDVLIKCIRANLMAPWFSERLSYRTALIVRHPCAVVESQYRLGKAWDPTSVLARYRKNSRLHEITEGRYLGILMEDLSTVEALTLNWVIENQWPVQQSTHSGYAVFFYEHLLDENSPSWTSLCESLGLASAPAHELLKKPSQQSAPKTARDNALSWKPRWQSGLTVDQLGSIQRILSATDCTIYDIESEGPVAQQLVGEIG